MKYYDRKLHKNDTKYLNSFQEEQKVSNATKYVKRHIASPLSPLNGSCITNISFSANAEAEVGNSGTKTRLQNLRLDAFDKLSVKIGSTLRRYPILRIFILFYMVSATLFDKKTQRWLSFCEFSDIF